MATETEQTQTSTQTPAADAATPAAVVETPAAAAAPADSDADKGTVLGNATVDIPEDAPADGEGDKTPEDAKADDAATGAPEAYELTAPEGMTLDADMVAEATPIFKELGLTNEQAQALIPLVPKLQEKVLASVQQAQIANLEATSAAWAAAGLADPEIGGSAENYQKHVGLAAKALDMLGFPAGSEFRQFLNESMLGNHPEMLRAMAKVGASISEDSFVRADPAAKDADDRPAYERVYPGNVPTATA